MVYGEEPLVLNPPLPPSVNMVEDPKPFDVRSYSTGTRTAKAYYTKLVEMTKATGFKVSTGLGL